MWKHLTALVAQWNMFEIYSRRLWIYCWVSCLLNKKKENMSVHSCPCMQIHVQMNVCVDNDMSWACSFSRVSHMLCCLFIGLPSELCSVSLKAPRRSRPGSRASVCRWSRYLCQGRASPSHQPPRVGPLGSTSTVRNGLGCGNMDHKIILTSPQRGPSVNTDKRSHAHRGTQHEEDTPTH